MASMNEKDYYEILGVDKDATTEQIRKAFQQKARKLHPDVNKEPDAEDRFKEVSEAYAVLSDADKRKRYDAMRSGNPFAGASSGSPSGYGYGDPFGGAGPFGWGPFGAGYNTGAGRSARARAYRPCAGKDVVFEVSVSAEKAKEGCSRGITYQRYVSCEACHGQGSVQAEHSETCPTCSGSGRIEVDLSGIFGVGVMTMECPECEGAGKVVVDPCSACGGSGRVLSASEIVISVPAGSHDGDEVRREGMGNAGTNGEAAGDFVARVTVPEERLSARATRGFYLFGFALPFLVCGFFAGTLGTVAAFVAVLMALGLFMGFREGVRKSGRWWRHVAEAVGNGISSGLILALFFTALTSCTVGLGRSGYMGPYGAGGIRG
ncbi:DnaJ domain-containing protein [Paratractidigestivibacter sp.]|uniref:DnaJ domain-containing protein n=1 Tax=Paratractidigestivibacter sp. TaxID=2847316 RepID=UPI002ABDC442|nr:DnaJ domain-containing protein [Paratractidigestivibacter sp.]